MQRIANLIAVKDGKVLLLQKPRRGWYVAPGGKMESGESIFEAAIHVHLKGVYTMVIKENDEVVDEWMLYTFVAKDVDGIPFVETREGKLAWHPVEDLAHLPMAEGDRTNLQFAISQSGIQYGTFDYTTNFELLHQKIQISKEQ